MEEEIFYSFLEKLKTVKEYGNLHLVIGFFNVNFEKFNNYQLERLKHFFNNYIEEEYNELCFEELEELRDKVYTVYFNTLRQITNE